LPKTCDIDIPFYESALAFNGYLVFKRGKVKSEPPKVIEDARGLALEFSPRCMYVISRLKFQEDGISRERRRERDISGGIHSSAPYRIVVDWWVYLKAARSCIACVAKNGYEM